MRRHRGEKISHFSYTISFYIEIGDGEVVEGTLTEYRIYTASSHIYHTNLYYSYATGGEMTWWCGCAVVQVGAPEPTPLGNTAQLAIYQGDKQLLIDMGNLNAKSPLPIPSIQLVLTS
jgi:hypothetical protein